MSEQNLEIEQIIITRLQNALEAEVELRDMTGTRDHWEAIIISAQFTGKRLIARQQSVYKALGELMSGPIHAFTMTTVTPEEAAERGINVAPTGSSKGSADDELVTLG